MKKLLLFTAVCTLLMTGCEGLFVSNDENNNSQEQNGVGGGSGDEDAVKLQELN